jgi:DHA1 family multidrug resistance protein-like MFS transporter
MTRTKSPSTATEDAARYPYWQRNLQVLPAATLMNSMGFAIAWPFLPLMVGSLGVRDNLETWMGYMMLVFYIISFLCGPIWGSIADYFGRKIMVLRAMLGMGFFMALIPFAGTPYAFAGVLWLVAVFNGGTMSSQALIVANTPPDRIGRALSRLQAANLMGQTTGPAVGALLVTLVYQPHWLFWISGGILLSAGMMVMAWVRETKQLTPGRWRPQWIGSLRTLLAVPRIGLLYLLGFVFAWLAAGNITILSVFVMNLNGNAAADAATQAASNAFWAGSVAVGYALSSTITLTICGRLLDVYDPRKVLLYSTAAAGLTQLPLLLLQTPLQLTIARIAFGFAASLMLPAIVRLLRSHAPQGMDARAISYAASFQFIAMGIAPFTAGLIGPLLGLRAYFAVSALLTFLAFGLWLRSERRSSKNASQ